MMFILDTNVVSEIRKIRLGKADTNVATWTASVDAADLFVSAITVCTSPTSAASATHSSPQPRSYMA